MPVLIKRKRGDRAKAAKAKRKQEKREHDAAEAVKMCAARDACFLRDEFKCVRCGKSRGIQCHHVVTRSRVATRHLLENLLTFCAGCHIFWWHAHPLESGNWFRDKYPERYALLLAMRNGQ